MAALQRAVALAQMDGVALAVAEHLDLDVARLLQVLLHVDAVVAEGGLRLSARRRQRHAEIAGRVRDLHAAPAAAGGGLDQHGKAHLLGDLHRLGLAGDRAVGPGHDRECRGFLAVSLACDLVAHDADVLGRRADEGDLVLLQDLGEAGVLREEAVAGMHRVGAGDLAGGEQAGNVEIALGGGRADRCRRSRPPGARAWRRRRRSNGRRRWRCRVPCRRAGCAARSLPGWRSGLCRTFVGGQ